MAVAKSIFNLSLKRFHSYVLNLSKQNKLMASSAPVLQDFDYFLVLDFEATCEKKKRIQPQEIIEFPCLKVNGKTFEIDSVFHHYVQPRVNRQLTSFCTELTGIIQDMVDGQPYFEDVMVLFDEWMKKENLLDKNVKSVFVTCGDWDLNVMLPSQCDYFKYTLPEYMKGWINIKKTFCSATKIWPKGIRTMLEYFLLRHQGRLHSGIDDCKNIAAILKALALKESVRLQPNGYLKS